MAMRRVRAFWKTTLLVVGSLGFSLLLVEAILRIIGFSNPRFFEADEILGWHLHAGAHGLYREEGVQYVEVNSAGWRDRERSLEKPPRTVRIAALGDSFCEARQVPLDDTFCALLERELGACRPFQDSAVEVLNFGVSGYGTAQEFLTLQTYAWSYDPDIVLLAFFPGNDLVDNSRWFVREEESPRPYFLPSGDTLKLDTSFRDSPLHNGWKTKFLGDFREHWLSYHSRLHELVTLLKQTLISRRRQSMHIQGGPEAGLSDAPFSEPQTEELRAAWTVTERLLLKTRDEVARHGARLVVTVLTTNSMADPDTAASAAYCRRLGVADLLYSERRIQAICERGGIECIPLAGPLHEYAVAHHVYLHGNTGSDVPGGHYNVLGHRLVASLLARYLCARPYRPTAVPAASYSPH